jgi:hypothetical protein
MTIERVGFGFEWVGSGKFDQKNCRVTGRVWVSLIRVGLGFRSNFVGFFQVLGRTGFLVLSSSDYIGFWVIRVRVGSGFRSSDIGKSWVSGYFRSGFGFLVAQVISGFGSFGFEPDWVPFCNVLFQVGSDFGSG